MIELLIVLSSFNHNSFNNSIYFEFCDLKYNVSYFHLDASDVIIGVTQNTTMMQFEYNINETCSTSSDSLKTIEKQSTEVHDTMLTRELLYTSTPLQTNETILQNVTSDILEAGDECNSLYYSFPIISVITFLIGCILEPSVFYKSLKKIFSNQLYAGNYISRIRIKL